MHHGIHYLAKHNSNIATTLSHTNARAIKAKIIKNKNKKQKKTDEKK